MSLDVSLILSNTDVKNGGSGIYVREDGQTKEISQLEWDEKFPGREPVVLDYQDDNEIYTANITRNLGQMAKRAGIYKHLWRPEELEITQAGQLIVPLKIGLGRLKLHPDMYKEFNPSNGWGDYEGLVSFVEEYLAACKDYPMAEIRISR